ncbi:hypothetical protein PR202_ga12720 [Eleusine coracana subsp. coracana]|uniref:O-fucosyltransferase family protein n=1 Tax=Eleusine coracana subsp. coracana TaxID=191504 RepID=A0AAV5CCN5_ELECO|nr:hypothetical protein PR202_ga12720 [Eleusine coracana subsp. coracana]
MLLLKDFVVNELWRTADSNGWRASSAPRTYWPSPPTESESNGGFVDVYDVPHFIKTLKYDVRIVMSVPKITAQGKTKKLRAYKIEPPRDAPVTWYRTTALEKIRKCIDIFTPTEQEVLLKYREEHFSNKTLVYRKRKLIGKCPLTPEEVGLIVRAMGFDNTTRIYLASGKLFGGKRFMKPFKAMFPRLENHSMVGNGKLEENIRGLAGSAVDYMVCLLSDIFIPTYDGPSNFANNLMGHRLYYGFRTTITPNRKALAPIFMDMEEGHASGYEERIRQVMFNTHFGAPHTRIHPESFYTNSWPECFCQMKARNHADQCPPNNVNDDVLESEFQNKENIEAEATNQTDSTSQIPELAGGTELAKVY